MFDIIRDMTQWTESLWGDEGFSAIAVQRPFGQMLGVVMRDTAPPLFYVVGWIWGRLFGFSEVSLRSLTLLLMIGTSIFVSLIVYKIQKSKPVAILAGLLVLLNPFLERFAFEWRMYAILAFTVTGSIYFWMQKKWMGYVIFTLAALYTHHFALFTVAGQALWHLIFEFQWSKPTTYLKQLRPYILVGLGYLPWIYPMYLQITRVKGSGFWLSVPPVSQLPKEIFNFVSAGIPEKWRWIMVGLGLLLVSKNWRLVGKSWVKLFVVFFSPVVLSLVVSYLLTPIFYDRYLLSVVVGVSLLLALGTRRQLVPMLLGLGLIYGYFSWNQFIHPSKRPFKQLAAYVKSEQRSGDYLINYNGRAHHLWESKYYGIPAPIYVPGEPLPLYVGTAQMTPQDTISSLPAWISGRLGVISSEPVEQISLPGYRLTEVRRFGELSVGWWQ
ncbi:MAG: hypothetical protein UX80_C0006G0017 [Candidatus Amesbacteria bacterium GW2011_GWA2_47_11b]|uniref:Glycosyltransferase RgtA/B/C/D-like domain-containing protein n=3 Tax=Candidatus Amesiibacteriota TaxID=1752730 RepID=A0A0G1SF62_9BACT|nr:MAG: hypothetical protein UX42_C0003G0013 [Microgenomates group bacterium GW2011_GWC1_46_20]KKU58047.1 MAG: hypothetical protein UX80_C0006G0017 [Candidatus Amesbacteria bacterium GW2011_GWA2_47_11b]KKU68084.1 MAG: hypothetical protein UX92_C0024G0019 [Candidatus Amesbacteria bacterium GW2011_GWA1_47_20]KKU83505.1 MAG: hypothetical protein UY11_C0018G0004 [Candidatus Amesbacteria bacterium GW2011_GWC2_47_8]